MIVIQRNGQTTVITGWRAWLIGAVAFIVVCAVLFVVAFVVLGLAITVGTILFITVPVLIGLAIIGSRLSGPR